MNKSSENNFLHNSDKPQSDKLTVKKQLTNEEKKLVTLLSKIIVDNVIAQTELENG